MKPYEDDTMIYDKEEHRYILKPEYILKKAGIKLNKVLNPAFSSQPQELATQFLDQISEEMYSWIYDHNDDNDIQEYFLATNEQLRTIIRGAMYQQVLFVMKSGDLFFYCGVNLKNGAVVDEHKIVENAMSPVAKMKLSRQISEMGTSIIYQGKFRYPYLKLDRRDY